MTTVAAIIIGDEILSGKTPETNSREIVDVCRETSATLVRIAFIGDAIAEIADEVRRCAASSDIVITSGGIGPTHDDRTIAAVAAAFAVPVVRDATLDALVRGYLGERLNDAALRLADVPAGARLIHADDHLLPLVAMENVFILPGVPSLFRRKLASVRPRLTGRPRTLRSLWIDAEETEIASLLASVDRTFPGVAIGSYPRPRGAAYRVWVTIEGAEGAEVEAAVSALLLRLPTKAVTTESPD